MSYVIYNGKRVLLGGKSVVNLSSLPPGPAFNAYWSNIENTYAVFMLFFEDPMDYLSVPNASQFAISGFTPIATLWTEGSNYLNVVATPVATPGETYYINYTSVSGFELKNTLGDVVNSFSNKPASQISMYTGEMTVGTYTFMTITGYGYSSNSFGWSTPGSLYPSNSDIYSITWADGGADAEKIKIVFSSELLFLGSVEINSNPVEFEIFDEFTILSTSTFSTNPFNIVGEISYVGIIYKLGES